MIDRSYLPFQSAREHQDRGMMKWMGFFLSEHTSSLHEDKTKENLRSHLDDLEKFTLLNQLYLTPMRSYDKDKQFYKHHPLLIHTSLKDYIYRFA